MIENGYKILNWLIAILFIALCLYLFILNSIYPNLIDRSNFGNFFNGFGVFLNIVTIVLVFGSFILQRDQNNFLKKENSEDEWKKKFFQILDLQVQSARDIRWKSEVGPLVFRDLLHNFLNIHHAKFQSYLHYQFMKESYLGFYKAEGYLFSRYINNSILLLQFVRDNSTISAEQKEFYVKLIRAQFTSFEIEFLYYHFCLAEISSEELSAIEFSGLLASIDPARLAMPEHQAFFSFQKANIQNKLVE